MNTGKTIGIILIVAGIGICVVSGGWLLASAAGPESSLGLSGAVFGAAIAFVVAAPVVGVGVFLLVRGQREAAAMAEVEKEQQLLGMIRTQGQVSIPEVAIELDVNRDQVEDWIYDLVDKGLFAGYVDWDDRVLYSRDVSQMKGDNRCPNCGGELELAGKGVVKCPYCGVEIFLTE
jgi:DNA-directed RNA polymerase subunit RPC12/RpoP